MTKSKEESLGMTSMFLDHWFYSGASISNLGKALDAKADNKRKEMIYLMLLGSCNNNGMDEQELKKLRKWLRVKGLALVCEKGGGYADYENECGVLKLLVDEGWGSKSSVVMANIASFM